MEQSLVRTLAVLERTPAALDAMLRGLSEEWVHSNEGDGTWSARDIVVHLANCDHAEWVPRAQMILESKEGEVRQFEPFDRFAAIEENRAKPLAEMLDEFARGRSESLATVRAWGLGPEQLQRLGRHRALGEVTLSVLMATWAAHDLTHVHQISRVMAHQYREAVGPWIRFIGVMQCNGHGA
jgi:hypothetical protein